jgi:hypothetical protein
MYAGRDFSSFNPDDRLGKGRGFVYLVTNRHVATCMAPDYRTLDVKSIAIRLNRKDGTSDTILLAAYGNAPWVMSSDNSEDLAVVGAAPSQEKYDYMAIPTSLFATKDILISKGVAEGERIVPADALKNLLDGATLQAQRDAVVAATAKQADSGR